MNEHSRGGIGGWLNLQFDWSQNTDRYINLTQFENTNFSLQLIVHILLLYIYINIFYTHAEWHTERCATKRANKIYLIFNWNKTKNYYNTTIYEYVIIHIIYVQIGWSGQDLGEIFEKTTRDTLAARNTCNTENLLRSHDIGV